MKVAVIADRGHVQKFARDTLDAIEGCDEITVFSCNNSRTKKKPLRHGGYYALNLVAVRNAWGRAVPVASTTKRIAETIEFDSGYDGAWQVLPPEIIDRLQSGGFDVIVKFGMGLLRVPPPDRLSVPILSYHHGDPDRYRGRPAGFWEMMEGAPAVGQIVQIIGNQLDAGSVVAFAETKVHRHSYKATLIEAFRHSPLIINQAIRNAVAGVALPKPCTGRNYRLPGNLTVLRFTARMAAAFARRLLYGAVMEKMWKVSFAPEPAAGVSAAFAGGAFPPVEDWSTVAAPRGYVFYADPFFSSDPPGLLVEGLNARSGVGEIVLVEGERHRRVSDAPGHMSYPATIKLGGRQCVVPEMAGWSPPKLFTLDPEGLVETGSLDIEGEPRLLDATLAEHRGHLYLLGNVKAVGSNALFLWCADSIDGPFRAHPASPIRISPEGGRMAGNLLEAGGRLVRLGQDFRFGYGDGICVFEIETLTPDSYSEKRIGSIRFEDRSGPHTLNVRNGQLLFDWYRDAFSLRAGHRRLLQKLRAQLARP